MPGEPLSGLHKNCVGGHNRSKRRPYKAKSRRISMQTLATSLPAITVTRIVAAYLPSGGLKVRLHSPGHGLERTLEKTKRDWSLGQQPTTHPARFVLTDVSGIAIAVLYMPADAALSVDEYRAVNWHLAWHHCRRLAAIPGQTELCTPGMASDRPVCAAALTGSVLIVGC
jgi:hypothetical protein